MQVRQTLYLLLAASFGVPAFAQDAPDLVGLWSLDKEESADPRCGASAHTTRLDVTKKITARAYRGTASTFRSTADCGVKPLGETSFTLRIRDRAVSVEYDDEAWPSQNFLLDGSVLIGSDEGGAPVEFIRTVAQTAPVVEFDFGRLDEMLTEMRPELYEILGNEYGTRMLRNLRRTGLDSKQARQVAEETIWRMSDCVIAMVREDLVAMSLPLDELINDRRARMLLNPKQLDYREYECIYDTALNAGVIIK